MLDPSLIGRTSPPAVHEVEKGAIRAFAAALGEENPIHHDEAYARSRGYPGLVAPPTFPATFRFQPIPGLELPLAGLIHGEQYFELDRPIVAGDRVTCVSRLTDLYQRTGSSGPMTFVVREVTGTDSQGERLFLSRSTVIVREPALQPAARAAGEAPETAAAAFAPTTERSGEIPPLALPPITRTQLVQYAGASGDFNPIHFDDEFARARGLGGVIAHGMLVLGLMARHLAGWAGEAGRLSRLQVRFRAPVRPGDTVTCRAWSGGPPPDLTAGPLDLTLQAEVAGRAVITGKGRVSPRHG